MPILLLVIMTALAGVVGDAVVESVLDGGSGIVMLGGSVGFDIDAASTLAILTGCSAVVALAWSAVVVSLRGHRVQGRLLDELDERWTERSQHNSGLEGRNKLLEFRTAELQAQLDDVAAKRDGILQEMASVKTRSRELARLAREQRDTIAELTGEVHEEEVVLRVPDARPHDAPQDTPEAGAEAGSQPVTSEHPAGVGDNRGTQGL